MGGFEMKKYILLIWVISSSIALYGQKVATPIINTIYVLDNYGVPLNTIFSAYISTGIGDSMQFEFDTSSGFNSPRLIRYTSIKKGISWSFYNPAAFRLNMTYKMRVRAFAKFYTASDYATATFKILTGMNSYDPFKDEEVKQHVIPEIRFANPGCYGEFQISDTPDVNLRVLYSAKLIPDTVNINKPLSFFVKNLPMNKRLYLRTRLYHFGDTTAWALRTFYINPATYLSTPVQTFFSSLLSPGNGYQATASDDSLVQYHFEISNNTSFTGAVKRTIWKVSAYNIYGHAPGSTNYVRYRVSYNGNFTAWSNTRTVTTYATIPDIGVTKDFRGYKKLNFYIGNFATRVQIESDTTLNFNSPRRILFDSAAPNPTFYDNYTWERVNKDWVNYRNIYTRYRFGNGTQWTAWSKPVKRYMNPVLTTSFSNNQHLLQRLDFDTLIGATHYILQCDTDSTFKTKNLLTKTYQRSEWNSFMSFPDIWRKYPKLYFRLMAVGPKGVSGWSHALVANQNCKAIISWPDSTELFRYPNKLSLYDVQGAKNLKYEVSYYRDFRKIWATVNNTAAPINIPELMVPLEYNTKVYVRAKFFNNIDSTPWSNVWPVRVEYYYYCMQKPILISPANKSIGVSSSATRFTWNKVPEATSYLFQLTDPANGFVVFSDFTDTATILVEGLPAGKKLQWQVLAMGNKKSQFFSERFEFTTDLSVHSFSLNKPEIGFWPNPASNILYINSVEVESVEFYNAGIQKVQEIKVIDGTVNIAEVPDGLYFIRMNQPGRKTVTQKLVISR